MEVGDYIVVNQDTTTRGEKSTIYEIISSSSEKALWQLRDLTESAAVINFTWSGREDKIMKIKNKIWLNFLNERDPWDFITKMQEFEETKDKKEKGGLEKVIKNRDYEVMNWALSENIVPSQEIIDEILKSGDLFMIQLLAQYKLFPSDETMTWAIENNLTKIISFLIFLGIIPQTADINWACLNLPSLTVEILLICGFMPDAAGTQYLLDSEDLSKQVLVKIFDLKTL